MSEIANLTAEMLAGLFALTAVLNLAAPGKVRAVAGRVGRVRQ